MSDTPITDAVYFSSIPNICDHPDAVYAVSVEFARQLERENAELKKDKERLDWVERSNLDVVFDEGDPDVGLPCSWLVGAQNKQIARESGGIRAAIDAAREAEKGDK